MPKPTPKAKSAAIKRPVAKKKPAVTHRAPSGPRRLQIAPRVWYKPLSWRNHPPVPAYRPLPKARLLFWGVLKQTWTHRKLFGGIVVVYAVLTILLVRGLSSTSGATDIKSTLDTVLHGFSGKVTSSVATFSTLLATAGTGATVTSGVYQGVLLIVCSLAFIWALRQALAKHAVRVRDSFYRGMYPLVPFLLTFMLLSAQLIPIGIGSGLYSTMVSYGIAIYFWEKAVWFLVFVALGIWSLRMVTASVFALYVVTLPNMTPLKAYRSARQLVYGRRLLIWRKLIFLPVVLLLIAALVELPIILFATPLAEWTFFGLSMLALPVIHGYLYNLYREML
ncbi:MAG TPA: hypothetical protein VLE99_02110 [Candidatus Saccharimonadales bacterium]|nr:hypothetical protein [Candidatus Saccharimonadales bacterium]